MTRPEPPRELSPELEFRLAGRVGAWLIRLWGATLHVDWRSVQGERLPARPDGLVIHAFWHRAILPLAYLYRSLAIVVLISRHRDGEYISQMICRLGFGVVRGSTTRGGLRALIEMSQAGRQGHSLGVTPDGPRGPARVLQAGILHIARRSGVPIMPMSFEAVRRTELHSWDRFVIPHPWSHVVVVTADPIRIPEEATPEELERDWAPRVTAALNACDARAALWRAERTGTR